MVQYHQLLRLVLEHGKLKPDRTGTGTYSVFGAQARFPLQDGFPALTTKKLHLRSIIYELLWFLRGETNGRTNTATSGRSMASSGGIGSRPADLRNPRNPPPASRRFST